ncbi:hypothetical protein [Thermoflavifilum aggregans]|uniref:hypothetical protein n=1 Tax=Thermoflavifilum aggregans TaxID=454188 RepID=UPI0012FEAF05|nr:hypothetical protein [Thermoflavifilum aggregans]
MKKIIFFCSLSWVLLSISIAQNQYINRLSTSSDNTKKSNKPVYQFKPAASHGKTAAPAPNSSANMAIIISQTKNVVLPLTEWKEFQATLLYKQRQNEFGDAFQNPSHSYTMDEGTRLTIHFLKKPSFEDTKPQINTQIIPGLPVHGSSSTRESGWNGHHNVQMLLITLTLTFTTPDGSSAQNDPVRRTNVNLNHDAPTANSLFDYNTGNKFQA